MPFYVTCLAQRPIVFNGQPNLKGPMDITFQTLFYEDASGDTLTFATVKRQHFIPLPKAFTERKVAERPLIVNWLKFSITNTSFSDSLKLVFSCNTHVAIRLYTDSQPANKPFFFEQITTDAKGMQLTILPNKTNTYYVRIIEYVHYLLPLNAELNTPATYLHNYQLKSSASVYLFLVMCAAFGCMLFMAIYACYLFFLTRDGAAAFYMAYVCCGLYVWLRMLDTRLSLGLFDLSKWTFNIPLGSGIVFFYALFIASMLEIPAKFPKRWKILKIILGLIILETIIEIIDSSRGRFIFSSNIYYLYIQNIPNLITNIYLIYLIITSKGPLKKYLLAGLLSLFFFLIVATNYSYYIFIAASSLRVQTIANFPPLWGMLGVVTESVCFAFALAFRSKLEHDEKTQLQAGYAIRLEKELEIRTAEIQKQNRLLEDQKITQMEIAFGKKMAETEMTALRAQMNPHFIFNCLNSIKLYVLENDSQTASAYLSTFSRLIRLVLENSQSEKVTLENELENLRLYLELEVMRFKDKVSYQIHIDKKVDPSSVDVPPLLLQPYVENAIWHGLMHKEYGGKVAITVTPVGEHMLHVEITDDGIGREKAAEYNSKSITKHKSSGLTMAKDRIQVINQLYNIHTEVKLVDLVDDEGSACGTKVIIDIPI